MAGKKLGVAQLEAGGDLSTRRACSAVEQSLSRLFECGVLTLQIAHRLAVYRGQLARVLFRKDGHPAPDQPEALASPEEEPQPTQ